MIYGTQASFLFLVINIISSFIYETFLKQKSTNFDDTIEKLKEQSNEQINRLEGDLQKLKEFKEQLQAKIENSTNSFEERINALEEENVK